MSDLVPSLVAAGLNSGAAIRIASAVKASSTSVAQSQQAETVASAVAAVAASAPVAPAAPAEPFVGMFSGPIETKQSAVFNGNSLFSGSVELPSSVLWGGEERRPAVVSSIGTIGISEGNIHIQPIQTAVLNDYGMGQAQKVVFSASGTSDTALATMTLTPTSGSVNVPNSATFTPATALLNYVSAAVGSISKTTDNALSHAGTSISITTQKISIPTTVIFDPEACSATLGGYVDYDVVTDVTLNKGSVTCVTSVSSTPATPSSASVVTGGSVGLSGSLSTFLTGISSFTTNVPVLTGGISVEASIVDL